MKNVDVISKAMQQQLSSFFEDKRPRMKWSVAIKKYAKEAKNKNANSEQSLFRTLSLFLGGLYLDEINKAKVQEIIDTRLTENVRNSTINRSLQKLKAVLNKAHKEWEVRCDPPYIKLLKEPKIRVRWLKETEANRLLSCLPSHLKDMAEFTLETGLRESNVTLLRWDQIDFDNRVIYIEGDDILKTDKPFIVPLSQRATEILQSQLQKHPERVFTFRGKPVRRANTKAFKNALTRARIEDFRWHDLRHTWATWHVQRGTPLDILQELGGWTSHLMVKRYAHYSFKHLHQYVEDLGNDALELARHL